MTTISEELVRLEEAREKATDIHWYPSQHGVGIMGTNGGNWIISNVPDVHGRIMTNEDESFITIARNCPVNFRKLAELVAWCKSIRDLAQGGTIYLRTDGDCFKSMFDALAALEEGK